ncbi:hypothetical protein BN14_01999 [Rhizoctonia solani AG-1 IB]|uniref:Uncharacterized protein n=1 Tax=Thanatephorus cucumeris (strain AG1-IB / isolate 7/3/14) TaxID=1108050 RepID=M5BKV0_THACB|nr:hypothetical protein BN14_01999 [Rhizoctonia solani AG-1 IB]
MGTSLHVYMPLEFASETPYALLGTFRLRPNIQSKLILSIKSGVASLVNDVKAQAGITVSKRLESSDPTELDLAWLRNELASPGSGTTSPPADDAKKPFAKPRGPVRRKVM